MPLLEVILPGVFADEHVNFFLLFFEEISEGSGSGFWENEHVLLEEKRGNNPCHLLLIKFGFIDDLLNLLFGHHRLHYPSILAELQLLGSYRG